MAIRTVPRQGGYDGELVSFERAQYVEAAERALQAYPGALGQLVHRELLAFAKFGYRLDGNGLIPRLAAELLLEIGESEAVRSPGSPGELRCY